jgi:glycosyltransferase involved in cell wall biosynthesis
MTTPLVSIVMPTLNGAATLSRVLPAIKRQQVPFAFEIVAVDSGSTDGTVALLHRFADSVVSIAPEDFDHGLTRNLGVERSRGALVVLMVQDAEPASDRWLAALTAPLLRDPCVAGSFARQVPRVDASPLTRHYLSLWAAASDSPRASAISDAAEFDRLDPMRRFDRCVFDNVCACIRRSVWSRRPFRTTPIAEDLAWAKDVLLDGHRLVFAPDAEVIHSHDRSASYELARTYVLHRRLYELFELRTIPSLNCLARAIASSLRLHVRYERSGRSLALAFAWPLGQYLGGRAAVRGWKTNRVKGV